MVAFSLKDEIHFFSFFQIITYRLTLSLPCLLRRHSENDQIWNHQYFFARFAWRRERISVKMHSIKSRFAIRPSNILSEGLHVRTFQPGNCTGWGSEGVNADSVCSWRKRSFTSHTKKERRKDLLMYLDVLCGYVFSSANSVASSSKLNPNISQPAAIANRSAGLWADCVLKSLKLVRWSLLQQAISWAFLHRDFFSFAVHVRWPKGTKVKRQEGNSLACGRREKGGEGEMSPCPHLLLPGSGRRWESRREGAEGEGPCGRCFPIDMQSHKTNSSEWSLSVYFAAGLASLMTSILNVQYNCKLYVLARAARAPQRLGVRAPSFFARRYRTWLCKAG